MISKTLTKAEADKLFSEKSMLIGKEDVVPIDDVINLFGQKSWLHVIDKNNPNKFIITHGGYDTKEAIISYVTYDGFLYAVTYNNVSIAGSPKLYCLKGGQGK